MFLFPVTEACLCFVACMSLIHFHIPAPLLTSLFIRKYVFLHIIWPAQLFQIHSGQVNSIFYDVRIFGVIKLSHFRGYAFFFLLLPLTQYSSSKCIDRYRAILILMSLFLCNMSCSVCVFICSISSCSLSLFLLVVDMSPIPMISLTSISLSYVDTKKKQNFHVLSFSFSLFRCM